MSVVSRFSLPLAALALVSASSASALNLTDALVTGPTGTIWNTAQSVNYTLFLQTPNLGDFLNPNSEDVNFAVANNTITRFLLAGEGFLPGTTADSDPLYNLTLTFDDGQKLTGSYTPGTNTFNGGTSIVSGGQTFSLIEFSFRRTLGDAVQPKVATFGGDGNDYSGNFRLSAANAGVVPEPATWGLMIVGFGMVGAAARRRTRTSVTA